VQSTPCVHTGGNGLSPTDIWAVSGHHADGIEPEEALDAFVESSRAEGDNGYASDREQNEFCVCTGIEW
jgi:hypothetical protein